MHFNHDRLHDGEHSCGLVDDEVWAFGHDIEIVVGDQGGDLHNDVGVGLEASHF